MHIIFSGCVIKPDSADIGSSLTVYQKVGDCLTTTAPYQTGRADFPHPAFRHEFH